MTNHCQFRCAYCYTAAGPERMKTPHAGPGPGGHRFRLHVRPGPGPAAFDLSFHGGGQAAGLVCPEGVCCAARSKPLPAYRHDLQRRLVPGPDGVCAGQPGRPDAVVRRRPATQDLKRPFASGRGSAGIVLRTIAALDRRSFPYTIRMTATAPWERFPEDVRFIQSALGDPGRAGVQHRTAGPSAGGCGRLLAASPMPSWPRSEITRPPGATSSIPAPDRGW